MSKVDIELNDSDFGVNRLRMSRLKHRIFELPSRLRLAGQGAWRGKERGLAVITGVFLSSLVITTVLAYGVGLSQLFFEESLKVLRMSFTEFKICRISVTCVWDRTISQYPQG